MLDNDIQVGYYDSAVKKFVFRGDKVLEQSIDADDHEDAIKIYQDMYKIMKMRAGYYKHHHNLTSGKVWLCLYKLNFKSNKQKNFKALWFYKRKKKNFIVAWLSWL